MMDLTRPNLTLRSALFAAGLASLPLFSGCNLDSSSGSNTASGPSTTVSGIVTSTAYIPGSATDPTLKAGYYQGAKVCADTNHNGKCDANETAATTDANGKFTLTAAAVSPLIADIGTSATNTANGQAVSTRTVFRIADAQVKEQGANKVVISPLSTEVVRLTEANNTDYATEKQNLANRVGVTADQVLADLNTIADAKAQYAALTEANALTNRFAYAITKLDRGDLYPDALANPGGDPELANLGVTSATNTVTTDTRKPITFQQAEQAAFAVEGIPRYDHIFVIMLENKGTNKILNSQYAPKINGYMKQGNMFVSYYATGNPSEPNYTALGGADDFGITDDSQWNCGATGANAPQDTEPTNTQPGLASSPFQAGPTNATCTSSPVNHNVSAPNLFNVLRDAGLTWRTYSESMNPGQDYRTDSVGDSSITATDYNNPNIVLPLPGSLYKTKHHPGMAFQNVRLSPEFKYSNRTMGGGQWDKVQLQSTKYAIPAGYNLDQFGSDLNTGAVGNVNFVVPDQCDDMHGMTVNGTDSSTGSATTATDCGSTTAQSNGGTAIITRGDNYVDATIKKIQASPVWQNQQQKSAIVVMFDEGSATTGLNGCCGWNAAKTNTNPLKKVNGQWVVDTSVTAYGNGNRGHGESVFLVLTNQPGAPKGIVDTDAYSHFSFVRTLQDMFGLSDPQRDETYINRSKYTERFIAQNILNLPEYAGSADTHFDAVRPMNHAYITPAGYTQKQTTDIDPTQQPAQVGPDATQVNLWAIKQ